MNAINKLTLYGAYDPQQNKIYDNCFSHLLNQRLMIEGSLILLLCFSHFICHNLLDNPT